MNMFKLIMCILFLNVTMVNLVYADNIWFTSVGVERIYPLSNGDFVLMFDRDNPGCLDVQNPKYHRIVVGQNGVTPEGADKMFSTALAAALAKKTISIAFENGTTTCYINRLQINTN